MGTLCAREAAVALSISRLQLNWPRGAALCADATGQTTPLKWVLKFTHAHNQMHTNLNTGRRLKPVCLCGIHTAWEGGGGGPNAHQRQYHIQG